MGDAGDVGLGGQARQVGAGRQVRDLARCRVPRELGPGGQARQVVALGVLGEVNLAARRGGGELVLRRERREVGLGREWCDRARDRLVSALLRVEHRICHD